MELLTKVEGKKGGWQFVHPATGEVTLFAKQDELKAQIYADPVFAQEVKSGLIVAMMQTDEVIE